MLLCDISKLKGDICPNQKLEQMEDILRDGLCGPVSAALKGCYLDLAQEETDWANHALPSLSVQDGETVHHLGEAHVQHAKESAKGSKERPQLGPFRKKTIYKLIYYSNSPEKTILEYTTSNLKDDCENEVYFH